MLKTVEATLHTLPHVTVWVLEVRNLWCRVRALMRRNELLLQNAQVVDELLFDSSQVLRLRLTVSLRPFSTHTSSFES